MVMRDRRDKMAAGAMSEGSQFQMPDDAERSDEKDTRRSLSAAARRALAEAETRRAAAARTALPEEVGGRKGPDPARYGDWEVKGIASDF